MLASNAGTRHRDDASPLNQSVNPPAQIDQRSSSAFGQPQNSSAPVFDMGTYTPFGNPMAHSTQRNVKVAVPPAADHLLGQQGYTTSRDRGPASPPPLAPVNHSYLTPTHLAIRKTLPDLPEFTGAPSEWPIFINTYRQTTALGQFADIENLMRLQRSLKGRARTRVQAQLNFPHCVEKIIECLENSFGRPEYILDEQMERIRNSPRPQQNKLETLVDYSDEVQNLAAVMELPGLEEYVSDGTILRELVDRLPAGFKLDWLNHRESICDRKRVRVTVKHFGDWLHSLAMRICTVTPYRGSSSDKKKGSFSGTHIGAPPTPDPQSAEDSEESDTLEKKSNDPGKTDETRGTGRKNQEEKRSRESTKCGLCQETRHLSLVDCKKFHNLSNNSRWAVAKRFGVCRICLKNHRPYCDATAHKCGINNCQRSHHLLLHDDSEKDARPEMNLSGSHQTSQGILCRIVPVVIENQNNIVKTYAFLDEGSMVTMVEDWILAALQIQGENDPLHLLWTKEISRIEETSKRVSLTIRGEQQGAPAHVIQARSVETLGLPAQSVDVKELKEACSFFKGLPLTSYENVQPSIVIGLDNWHIAVARDCRDGPRNLPLATKCHLGWAVEGPWGSAQSQSLSPSFTCGAHICSCEPDAKETLHNLIKTFYEFDQLPQILNAETFSMEDTRSLKILESTVREVTEGACKYEAGLLWRYETFNLPDSRPMALKRHFCLEKRLRREPDLKREVDEQIRSYITKGYARELTPREAKSTALRTWYLPIFPVLNVNKPGKVRIVFDAAARVDGVALNSMLAKGPDLTASLFSILLRFRQEKVAMSGDVKEMFHQVKVREADQHVQRFLYRFNEDEDIKEYVLQVLTFGAACSPCIAQYVKNKAAGLQQETYPEAAEAVRRDVYVDDQLKSVATVEDGIRLGKEITFTFAQGGFLIRNWKSNSTEVEEALNPEAIAAGDVDISGTSQVEKVLGMFWRKAEDCFVFSLKFNKGNRDVLEGRKRATKRQLLVIQMSIFDPLGLLQQFIINIKLLIQDLWRTGSDWDQKITEEHQAQFDEWASHFNEVESLRIPRCYLTATANWDGATVELHTFVDAGKDAYAAACYLRIVTENNVDCRLISSKSRVARIQLTSIPRLELEAARLGTQHAKVVKSSLDLDISREYYWTDSRPTLGWVVSDTRSLPSFVAHRVGYIQDHTDTADWRWVPSSQNVADEASKKRENYVIKYESRWYKGPDFLRKHEREWPKIPERATAETEYLVAHHQPKAIPEINILEYDTWKSLLRAIVAKNRGGNSDEPINAPELARAEIEALKIAQADGFPSEIEKLKNNQSMSPKSPIACMNPYLDEDGVMRSNSRLENCSVVDEYTKRPIIMPQRHHLTMLICREYHERFFHINHETTINEIRLRYYIPALRRVINSLRLKCTVCKERALKPQAPQMAPYPAGKVELADPFTHTGIDCFGPILITEGRKTLTRYGLIFTCLATRAVYIHILHSLSTSSFIMGFQTFISRCGTPRVIYCDNGRNFVGAERVLKEEFAKIDMHLVMKEFVSPELEWRFNPPLAPHMGGSWERLIRTIKTALYSIIPDTRRINEEVLVSTLALIENMMNSRPLTYLPLNSKGQALTPFDLVRSSAKGVKILSPLTDKASVLVNSWKRAEECSQHFWKRWLIEYLPTLTRRDKWTVATTPLAIGDSVMIFDETLPRNSYPRGQVIEVHPGADGQVRSVTVQTDNGIYKRPAIKVAKLDLAESSNASAVESLHAGGYVADRRSTD